MSRSNIFFGVALVALGTLLLLDQLGTVDAWRIIGDWWPTLIVLAGFGQIVTRPRNIVGGVVVGGIGLVLLGWSLDVVDGIGLLWPLLLIGLGAWLLVGRRSSRRVSHGEKVDVVAIIGDRHDVVTGTFAGGEIVTVFDDATLDLRDATATRDPVLQVTTIFGDARLDVPESWEVRVSGPEIFGDVRLEGARRMRDPEVVLRLHVVTIFGDITIRSVLPSAQPRREPAHDGG